MMGAVTRGQEVWSAAAAVRTPTPLHYSRAHVIVDTPLPLVLAPPPVIASLPSAHPALPPVAYTCRAGGVSLCLERQRENAWLFVCVAAHTFLWLASFVVRTGARDETGGVTSDLALPRRLPNTDATPSVVLSLLPSCGPGTLRSGECPQFESNITRDGPRRENLQELLARAPQSWRRRLARSATV